MIAAMEGTPAPIMLPGDDPVAIALLLAVRSGDLAAVGSLLAEHPGLARARLVAPDGGTRTRCTWPPTGPGTFLTVPKLSGC